MSFRPSALSFAVGVTAGVAGAAACVAAPAAVLFAVSVIQRGSWLAHDWLAHELVLVKDDPRHKSINDR